MNTTFRTKRWPLSLLLGSSLTVLTNCAIASGDSTFGGMHVGYAIGGSVAETNAGLRHGLDLAFLPILAVTLRGSGIQSFQSVSGIAIGPSMLLGFGDTPNYLGLDIGYGASSILGFFVGAGPVYRFGFDAMREGYGLEGRLAFDFLFIDSGLRLMTLYGEQSSEIAGTVFVGVGRF